MANRKTLIDLAGLFFLGLVVFLGYQFSPLLLPPADLTLSPDKGCDLHKQACAVEIPGQGKVSLSMSPRPIPLMSPFRIEVKLDSLTADSVEVDFTGVDMNMGLNRFALRPEGKGFFAAEASIPVCVTGQMEWQANVMILSGRQRISVPFRFAAGVGAS